MSACEPTIRLSNLLSFFANSYGRLRPELRPALWPLVFELLHGPAAQSTFLRCALWWRQEPATEELKGPFAQARHYLASQPLPRQVLDDSKVETVLIAVKLQSFIDSEWWDQNGEPTWLRGRAPANGGIKTVSEFLSALVRLAYGWSDEASRFRALQQQGPPAAAGREPTASPSPP